MPSGVYRRRPRPEKVRQRISRSLREKKVNRLYPWEKWFAKNRVKFFAVKGEDFTCSVRAMLQMIRNRASERKVGIDTCVEGPCIMVSIIRKPVRRK